MLLPAAVAAAVAGDEDDGEVVEKVFPLPSWDEGLLLLVLGVEVVRARWGVAGDGRGEPGLLAKYSCSWKRLLSFGKARTFGSSESKESICFFRLLSIGRGVVSKAVNKCWCVEVKEKQKRREVDHREFSQRVEFDMATTTLLLLRHFSGVFSNTYGWMEGLCFLTPK